MNQTKRYRELRICKCGHLHFLDGTVEKAIKADEEVILVCGHCGKMTRIGADSSTDYGVNGGKPKKCYSMYSIEITNDTTIMNDRDVRVEGCSKEIYAVIYSKGEPVPMKTGYSADHYFDGRFYDNCFPETDFQRLLHHGSLQDIAHFYAEWQRNRQEINMPLLEASLNEEQRNCIKGYMVFQRKPVEVKEIQTKGYPSKRQVVCISASNGRMEPEVGKAYLWDVASSYLDTDGDAYAEFYTEDGSRSIGRRLLSHFCTP